jgi:hypothetical protein
MHEGDNSTPKRKHVNWNSELLWKMRMELAYQWDMLEDEVQVVFEKLMGVVRGDLLYMKVLFSGKSGKALREAEHVTNTHGNGQKNGCLSRYLTESTLGFKTSSTSLA